MTVRLLTQVELDELMDLATRLGSKGLDEESQRLRGVLGRLDTGPDAVSAATAAEILAVTPQTVRNWVRAGILGGHRDDTGHFYVKVDELESAVRMRRAAPDVSPRSFADEEIDAEIAAVRSSRRHPPRAL